MCRGGLEQRGAAHNGGPDGGPAAARAGRRLRRGRSAARASLPYTQPTGMTSLSEPPYTRPTNVSP